MRANSSACWRPGGLRRTVSETPRAPSHSLIRGCRRSACASWPEARFAAGIDATPDDYHAHRIALGVPEGGKDYAFGDAFPHEADLDQLGGVSFDKGCFVGQEVVSRMQHRAAVRKRVVPVEGEAALIAGVEVNAGAATIGVIGSVAGRRALAMLRLDRAAEAKAKGEPITAGGVPITLVKPAWATFALDAAEAARTAMTVAATSLVRCPWFGIADPIYERYHDEEWGVPKADDRALFEKLVLEGFQAGLSWITILRKRENFRRAFDGFDAERIARYGKDIARLMADAGIVRNRLKIEATIDNARALLKLHDRVGLAAFIWDLLGGAPQTNQHRSSRPCRPRRPPPRRSPRR